MAKIRKLTLLDIKKLQKLVDLVDNEMPSNVLTEHNFTPFPLDVLHDLLPVDRKFLQESYVAVEDNEILGLIGIIADGHEKSRWKINRLILNTNAYDVGKQLVDYVVNKYGGAGIETFLTVIDDRHEEAISLFKNACMFRSCAQIQVWSIDNLSDLVDNQEITDFVPQKPYHSQKLYELYQQALFPQFRPSLTKSPKDFEISLVMKLQMSLKKESIDRFVLNNPDKKSIEGYFTIYTADNKDFWFDVVLSLGYTEYYETILKFVVKFVTDKNPSAKLNVYARKYFQNSSKLVDLLEKNNFKWSRSYQVLVKDYWKPAKLKADEKKSPIIIFPDITSPAFKGTKL